MDTSHGQQLLWNWGADETSTSWSWDESDGDTTALAGDLAWHGVWGTDLVTPVTSSDWHDGELGQDDSTTDGSGDFLRALDSQTDVTVVVSDGDDGLEAGTLTGLGLLLDWLDLEHLILQHTWVNESVDNLRLLDWQREQVDLLQLVDLLVLDQSAELGDWIPALGLLLATTAATWRTTATTTATTTTATSSATAATTATSLTSETTLKTASLIGWSCCVVRHVF